MSDDAKGARRHLDLVSMGCRWRLDVGRLPEDDAAATAERWQRAISLVGSGTPLLDEEPVTIDVDPQRHAYDLSRELTREGLLRLRGEVGLLHAAALADEGGRALVLVAPSGGGKSTATGVLGRELGYVSDETVVLLEDGRIAPHPKPPSLIVDSLSPGRKEEPPPDELGLGATPATPRIAALLVLDRDPEVTRPVIESVGLIDQLLEVLPQTSSMWWLRGGLDRLARAVTAGGGPARLRYAEIEECRELVAEHLAAAAPVAPTWEHIPPSESHFLREMQGWEPSESHFPKEMRSDVPPGARLVRAPWSDAIAVDGEVLVLIRSSPLRLAGPGAVLWRAASSPRSLAELTDEVVAVLGAHPDAPELVRDALTELVEHGALRVSVRT